MHQSEVKKVKRRLWFLLCPCEGFFRSSEGRLLETTCSSFEIRFHFPIKLDRLNFLSSWSFRSSLLWTLTLVWLTFRESFPELHQGPTSTFRPLHPGGLLLDLFSIAPVCWSIYLLIIYFILKRKVVYFLIVWQQKKKKRLKLNLSNMKLKQTLGLICFGPANESLLKVFLLNTDL